MTLPPAIRKSFFYAHLAVGIAVGLWVVFMATTGSLIALQAELMAGAEHHYRLQQPSNATCVAPSLLSATAMQQAGKTPSSLVLFRDPYQPAEVQFGRQETWLMDGCRGTVVAPHVRGMRAWMGQIMELHYALSFRDVPHPVLREWKNAMNLGFSFLIVSGLLLWLPRKMTWQHTRPALLLRWRATGRARDWNRHTVAGIWFAFPLLAISLSGTVMAYSWAASALYLIAGEKPPVTAMQALKPNKQPIRINASAINQGIAALQQREPQWQRLELRFSKGNANSLPFSLEQGGSGNPRHRVLGQISPTTGSILRFDRFQDNPRGLQWKYYARFIHTGELFGIAGKLLVIASCIAALLLVWTGFALFWHRLTSRSAF